MDERYLHNFISENEMIIVWKFNDFRDKNFNSEVISHRWNGPN